MSFITALESDISKVEKVLESWWGKEPAFYNVLSVGVNIVGISLETVFTIAVMARRPPSLATSSPRRSRNFWL